MKIKKDHVLTKSHLPRFYSLKCHIFYVFRLKLKWPLASMKNNWNHRISRLQGKIWSASSIPWGKCNYLFKVCQVLIKFVFGSTNRDSCPQKIRRWGWYSFLGVLCDKYFQMIISVDFESFFTWWKWRLISSPNTILHGKAYS